MTALLSGLTSVLALIFALALLDQWRERRRAYQLIWAIGMLWFSLAAACEAFAALSGWNEILYRLWFLAGGVWTVGWLGLGTAFLLGKTRFGYGFALCLFFAGLFTFLAPKRSPTEYADAGLFPLIYFLVAGALALGVAVETYFQNERWPWLAAAAVVGATLLSVALMATTTLPAPGYAVDPNTQIPLPTLIPANLLLLTPFMNITGSFALVLGALFSAYVFMPKKRVLAYSLDAGQSGDSFLFNIIIAPIAITVNFIASLPGALRELVRGHLNSRVPATLLLAIGAFIPAVTDSLFRLNSTQLYEAGHLLGVVFLFIGFLVSIEVFREIRIPFTHMVLRGGRREAPEAANH